MCQYQIFGYTIENHGKEKNGDSFLFKDLPDEKILLAIVSDGVSGQPCDWKASATVCENVLYHFLQINGHTLCDRLRKSILLTNGDVIRTPPPCGGMSATVTALSWDYSNNCYVIASVGDSRVYSVKNLDCICLTKDDVIKHKESIYTALGKRFMEVSQLTQVVGKSNLDVQIVEGSVDINEILMLATDGFYGARPGSFHKLISKLAGASMFKEGFDVLISDFEMMRGDDLTIVALKRTV